MESFFNGVFIRCALFAHDVRIARIGLVGLFGLEAPWNFLACTWSFWLLRGFFCEKGNGSAGLSASLQSRRQPQPKGSEAQLRDYRPSGPIVLGKIGMWLRRWDSWRCRKII